ncbi:Pyridoxal phosphate-dependent transferase major region subdomain 2 [Fusarium albosuccineum]|uniref:Pyridoxal phosphate-dependent transferase major region subdomain 2 n=1 Tax=Fusarium albosuccineum TaxID=1237068 RepID=A0A8H4LDA9_9HYPO|nr:Pyridoxal phosphate-dependent transferase major region subdomain 2 [Fusarium albosuccineum]
MASNSADTATLQRRLKALEPVIQAICKVAGAPGISLSVSRNGEPVHRASFGFADLETKKPVTGSTQFPIGTMAKTFTAAAVSALVAEGKLKWETHIKSIIPELQTASATVTENLTIVDLLSHRSGLGRSNFWWQGADATLLLEKRAFLTYYNSLPLTGQFRADWGYSNWGYALAGEVIERVSGTTYARYLEEKVYAPLGLKNTTVEPIQPSAASGLARPYAAMDDASLYPMPQPPINGSTIMAPALGGVSSADDLTAYSIALLKAFRHEAGLEASNPPPVIKHGLQQLSGHIFTAKALLEKSYAFGWYRTQLPNTVLGMGWNSIYVKKMPKITPRTHVGPLIAHGGSLPGYHVSIALLPEIDSSVVVCTNSIALGDVSGWVSMALIEALIDAPEPSDYLALASEAAGNAALNVKRFEANLKAARSTGGDTSPPRSTEEYVGRYRDEERGWVIDVRARDTAPSGLEVAFQGLDSQAWALSHHEHDTFSWLASREEQAKRGRMVTYPLVADHFKLHFQASHDDGSGKSKIDRLLWKHEAGAPAERQYLKDYMGARCGTQIYQLRTKAASQNIAEPTRPVAPPDHARYLSRLDRHLLPAEKAWASGFDLFLRPRIGALQAKSQTIVKPLPAPLDIMLEHRANMSDLLETVVMNDKFGGVSGAPRSTDGTNAQEKVAHPLENVPPGKLGNCQSFRRRYHGRLANRLSINAESLNALQAQFTHDVRPHKADLMCGVYQTLEGNPLHERNLNLTVSLQARQMLFDDPNWDHEYPASHLGEAAFRDGSARLLFGEMSQLIKEKRLASMQALGGSGACHMGAKFLRMHYEPYKANPRGKVYIPAETWVNHRNVFQDAGFETANLPYYSPSTHAFDFDSFNEALGRIPPQSIVVLQVCGNNPTGCDPSAEEWERLAQTFQAKHHFAFLDLSYPGFVSGSVAEDCAPIRMLAELGTPLLLAATYGKSFGLYGERVGHLCVPLPTTQAAVRAEQQMKLLARAETGAQPRFGAKLVASILGTPRIRTVWEEDLRGMARDMAERRQLLERELVKQNAPGDWSFVTSQVGMFLYTAFDLEQVNYLREEHAVYLQDTGRLSIAGLNTLNTAHVAASMAKAASRQKQ